VTLGSADFPNCFNSFAISTRGDKTVETVPIHAEATTPNLKLGVNENREFAVTVHYFPTDRRRITPLPSLIVVI
jgi:hypothetical protein